MTTFVPRVTADHENLDDCLAEVHDLRAAMERRAVIEQAKGMLIAEHGCTADQAFQMLADASQRYNRKLRDIAEAMVHGAQSASPGCDPADCGPGVC